MAFRVGKFEKVSFEQFQKDMVAEFGDTYANYDLYDIHNNIKLPTRSSKFSAGYDFKSPIDFTLKPNETIIIPTGIRVIIEEGWFLGCFPRSGLGFKYFSTLANTTGIVDADYAYTDNSGHIKCKLINRSPVPLDCGFNESFNKDFEKYTMTVTQGQGYMQGIFLPYGITFNDNADGVRVGGFGSSDKGKI